jgi:ribosomal protein S18 acetylase RimI-like enzyme
MQVSFNQTNKLNFGASILSQWRCCNGLGKPREISVVSIEKKDIVYINKLIDKITDFQHIEPIRYSILISAINTIKQILSNNDKSFLKTKMLMAVQSGKPCGFLVANMPKKILETDKIVYSSRHNPAKNETEIDWFVTWDPNRNERIKGIGKALISEYFKSVKSDKFKDVFVKSEIPEYSYAVDFYNSMGFERIGKKRTKLSNKTLGRYTVENYSDKNDITIPMIITKKNLSEKFLNLSQKMFRREFVKNSIDLQDLME